MTRREIKTLAKQQIKGNVLMYLLVSIIYAVLSSVIPGVAQIILLPVLTIGMSYIHIDMRDGKGIEIGRLFAGFYDFGRSWCAMFLVSLYTSLWSLLFFIPGIVKSFSYAMTPYILIENPGMTASEAITASRNMMNGHKWELFVLFLSFVGWFFLGLITCGLSAIYSEPYYKMSVVNFYDSIKNNRNA